MNIADLMITSLETINVYTLTGEPWFTLDELQNATISNTMEKEDFTGKAGRKLGSLKRNKAVTVSGTNGLLSTGLLEAQAGSTFVDKTVSGTVVEWMENLTITSNASATTYKAIGTSGAEITGLYIKDSSGVASTKLTQAAQAAAGKFAYDPSTKALSFYASAYPNGTEFVVYYKRNVAGHVMSNSSEKYSGKGRIVIDAFAEDKCASVYRVQIEIPKADFDGNFDIAMGDSQAVHSFEAESLAGACGRGGNLWNYTVFSSTAVDVAVA